MVDGCKIILKFHSNIIEIGMCICVLMAIFFSYSIRFLKLFYKNILVQLEVVIMFKKMFWFLSILNVCICIKL